MASRLGLCFQLFTGGHFLELENVTKTLQKSVSSYYKKQLHFASFFQLRITTTFERSIGISIPKIESIQRNLERLRTFPT
jgi:hypothetical protein